MAVEAAETLNREIRVIGSTDMTHYGPNFGFTPAGPGKEAVEWVKTKNDSAAIDAMKAMDDKAILAQGLDHHNMCCPGAVAAAAAAARKWGQQRRRCWPMPAVLTKTRPSPLWDIPVCCMAWTDRPSLFRPEGLLWFQNQKE